MRPHATVGPPRCVSHIHEDRATKDGSDAVRNGARADIDLSPAPGKSFATLRAKAALAGWTLAPEGEGFLAGRWGHTRFLAASHDVEMFLQQIGAPK